jgi:hypothetical protein
MNQLFTHIKNAQGLYPRLFSQTIQTDFGTLFFNPRNTLSVEANHGVILQPLDDYAQAIESCRTFYKEKNILPRLYCYLPQEEEHKLTQAVKATGGTLKKSPLKLLTCRNPKERTVYSPLSFSKLQEWDPFINHHIIGENLHLEGILRGSMESDHYTLTVGYMLGTPVTMASIWDDGQVMRISNVMTGEAFRGCGFAFSLILHQLNIAAQKQKPVYLFADNPVAIRVYERAGMTIEQPNFSLYIWEDAEHIQQDGC